MLPVLNVPAASALALLWRNRGKSRVRQLAFLTSVGMLLGSCALTALFAAASRLNYPGGYALAKLHSMEEANGRSFTQHKDDSHYTLKRTQPGPSACVRLLLAMCFSL